MPIVVDLYTERSSWLHSADPRVKLLFVVSAIMLLIAINNLILMVGALLGLILVLISAKIPLANISVIFKALLPISLLMPPLWVLFYPTGTPIFEFWMLKFTALSLAQGFVVALRINAMALAASAWLFTTSNPLIVRSLVKLRMPYEWGLVLALALRYIPTFVAMYGVISEAQQARGLRIAEGPALRRLRAMMPIFVAMVIGAFRASEDLARSLESRGFGARGVQRTYLRDIRFRPADYAYTVLLLALTAGLLYLNVRHRFGADPINLF